MAMLAEKRTKTKYFLHHKVLNAKGFSCLQGSDSFGHRMLERMGWSQGKGLGTNMDGIKEPIKLTYKCDNKGIGCDKSRDGEEAVAQQKEFDALLATLSQEATDKVDDSSDPSIKNTPTSLELRSQKSRARVHYHKFTRGKDLSRATSKDLASILGAPAPKPTPPPAPVVPAVGPVLTYDHIETTGTNIRDYFKHKFESKKRKIENAELSPVPKKCKVSNSETFTSAVDQDSEENMKQSNKVKSKKKDKRLNSEVDSHDLDESVTKGRRKSVTWGEVEVSFVSKYIKDMVDTSSESVTGDISIEKHDELESCKESSIICDERKKKKKDKKKKKSENTNVGVNDKALDGSSDGIVERSKDKKEKEKKPAEESAEDNESVENKSLQNNFSKKQKKQRRGKEEQVIEDMNEGTNFIIGSEDHNIALGMDKKKKKRKKKKSKHCEEIISTEECVEKKRKEYPVADPSDSKQGDGDLVIDSVWKDQQKNPEEGKRKKRKKNKESVTVMSEGNFTENENSNLECVPEELPKLNPAPCESSNTPVLSVLTQARIEKWKKRKKNNLKKIEVQQSEDHLFKPDDFNKNNVVKMGVENNSEVKMKKNTTLRLQYNPNQHTQDYNHRKLLVTLGVSRKLKSDKVVSVVMPESNFKGSNLDSIPGYGRAIPSL